MSEKALSPFCDGCGFLEIEPPVNRYDVWRACCCDPDKPLPGARRVVGVAPGGSRTGPVGVRRPRWCGRGKTPQPLRGSSPCTGEPKRKGIEKAATVAETP